MGGGLKDFLTIKIDFEKSHTFFPRIIITILLFLLVIIIIKSVIKKVREGKLKTFIKDFKFFEPNYDKLKLFGLPVLMIIYFISMGYVGRLFPNQGLGFLITSIPFVFLLSILLVGKNNFKKHWLAILINTFATPFIAWYVFAKIFFITLP